MLLFCVILGYIFMVEAEKGVEGYKDQYCTDPRTMKKHPAYSEWADAYSCTRHRCQPGGRNLAIYTVGCKRVEAPESAIECEEVVEDTNMQFPYCCTRLRCLVVVRGEVWTRVLGQPWETLPAAPWSHMYKMKRPPPGEGMFDQKPAGAGPVYELLDPDTENREKTLRTNKVPSNGNEFEEAAGGQSPDIVIALSTHSEKESKERSKKTHKNTLHYVDDDQTERRAEANFEESPAEKLQLEPASEEKIIEPITEKSVSKSQKNHQQVSWTDVPQTHWEQPEAEITSFRSEDAEKKEEKGEKLQALVDAIGTRMRDIESVVQKMNEPIKKKDVGASYEKSFASRKHSKYSRASEAGTEQPLYAEDTNLNGYYSDAVNSVLRRASPKEPAQSTYMAPVENRRKTQSRNSDSSDEAEKKHKKHAHKHKKNKKTHKKHKSEKHKKFNKLNSNENEKNTVSVEDSSGANGVK